MKICFTIYAFILTVLIFGFDSSKALAEKNVTPKYPEVEQSARIGFLSPDKVIYPKNENKKLGNVNFIVFDSLANVYSYGNMMSNKAIKYNPQFNTLVTVKRGYVDLDKYPAYPDGNTKNNLFLRTSTDWGKTWAPEIKLYDNRIQTFHEARYPSVATFNFGGNLAVAYNAARVIEKQSVWTGHIIGFWNQEFSSINIGHANPITDYTGLEWGIDSRVIADANESGEGFYHFIAGRVSPTVASNTAEANNIGWRRTIDIDNLVEHVIPDQWASSNFRTVAEGFRSNELVDLKKDNLGNFYLAVFGGFEGYYTTKNSFGVSKSTDKGNSWTSFNIIPWNVVNAYTMAKGHPSDSANFLYQNKGFVVLDNGEYSFATKILAWGNGTTESYIVELVYNQTTDTWRINEIADELIGTFNYRDINDSNDQPTNWNDHELDIVRTVDGQTLLAKWVEIMGFNPETSTFQTTDVFFSTRSINSNTWSEPMNVTNSDDLDRMTLLPDYIPNDLIDIPLFKLVTKTAPEMTAQEAFTEQFYGGKDQYLVVGHVNAVVGVKDEEPCDCDKLQIQKITPNPISGDNVFTVTIFMPQENTIDISIYDASGKLVNDLKDLDKRYGQGQRILEIDLTGNALPIGSYYINILACGQNKTKLFNVIR